MDEKGANFEAIKQVFGPEFRQAKTKTCQWNFIHCAEQYLAKAPDSQQKKFRKWCRELCDAHTQSEYENVSEKIKIFCKEYEFEGWWSPRCPHIVPALRGFNIPKMNMAETGQSKLEKPKKIWLSTAVTADVVELTFQQEEYEKFITNSDRVHGHGPTQKQHTQREHAEERCYVDQFCNVIENGNILAERDDDNSSNFVPSVKAKHHPPNTLTGAPQERPKKTNFRRGNRKCGESLNGKNEEKEEEEEEEDDEEEEEVILKVEREMWEKAKRNCPTAMAVG